MVRNINFTWTAVNDPTITKWHLYEVFPAPTSRQLLSSGLQNTQRSLTVGLDDVVAHTCVVTAENGGGEGPASPSVVVPSVVPPVPAAPTSLTYAIV